MISIIIPVYNKEKYLSRVDACLQRQTYRDFEVIYVDDGSTDHSAQMLDQLAKGKESYVVIHQKNGGVSSARNEGIRRAKGEWLAFIDPDDTVENDYLERMVDMAQDGIDLVAGDIVEVDDNDVPIGETSPIVEKSVTKEHFLVWLYKPKYTYWAGSVISKLYKTQIIKDKGLFFDESQGMIEDGVFVTQYVIAMAGRKISFTKPIYRYNRGNINSITHNANFRLYMQEVIGYAKISMMIDKARLGSIELVMRSKADTYKQYRRLLRRMDNEEYNYRDSKDFKNMKRFVRKALGVHWIYCWALWHLKFKSKC